MGKTTPTRLLKYAAVQAVTTLDRKTIQRAVAKGEFPPPIQVSRGRVAFRSDDVEAFIASRAKPIAVGGLGER